jgi:hypothetical protein
VANKIMVVRHAEKPDDPPAGVNINGEQDKASLIVRGWQRAGALAALFSAWGVLSKPGLAVPAAIYATDAIKHAGRSLRPQETITPIAQLLGLTPNIDFAVGEEVALAASAEAATGAVLIGWRHEAIPALGNAILGDTTTVPQTWPGDRFDMIWVFDRGGAGWSFTQIPQLLLSGDSNQPIG